MSKPILKRQEHVKSDTIYGVVIYIFFLCLSAASPFAYPRGIVPIWSRQDRHGGLCDGVIRWVAGSHFTNDFSITIQIRWKIHLALIQLQLIISQQNLAHATTAQLSCHVPNFVAITLLVLGWEQNEISITFELWWKNCYWNGPLVLFSSLKYYSCIKSHVFSEYFEMEIFHYKAWSVWMSQAFRFMRVVQPVQQHCMMLGILTAP